MKKIYYVLFTILIGVLVTYSYIKIDNYLDNKIIENNSFYNCDYWSRNYKDNETDTKYLNYMILTIKECKLTNQNKFLLNNLDNKSYIGRDFLSGKKFYIDQRTLDTLNIIYAKNYSKEEWKNFLIYKK